MKARGKRFSIVIVTYNSLANIKVCVDSLRRASQREPGSAESAFPGGELEIIVVDNDSRDGTPAYLSGQKDINALLNRKNLGFSAACNQGAAAAAGEFLVFLNPDTLVTRGWTERMARFFEDPAVGAVGPVSNYVAGLQRLDFNVPAGWREPALLPGEGAAELSGKVASDLADTNGGKGVITRLLIGFCLMMRRSLFQSLGGMDEDLFLGNDDLDLSWRLRNLGYKLVVASDAFVFHEGQKSFQTAAKSHVDRLVQESTDALYRKLVKHYGGRDRVPAPMDLWGIGWFAPSPSLLAGDAPSPENIQPPPVEAEVKQESKDHSAWKAISTLVYLGEAKDAAADRLDRTLSTLPAVQAPDVVVLDCTHGMGPRRQDADVRKLDLGPACPVRQALEIGISLAQGSHVLFCLAGVELSSLANHWLDKRDLATLGPALPLTLRIKGDARSEENLDGDGAWDAFAFLCRKAWLKETLAAFPGFPAGADGEEEFFRALALKIRLESDGADDKGATGSADSPALVLRRQDAPFAAIRSRESWTPIAAPSPKDPIALYPESLRPAMRASRNIAFAGAAAQMPPPDGDVKVYDLRGELVPLNDQDLIILRVTPDMLDRLPERMANIRRKATALVKMIVVFNGNQAVNPEGAKESLLAPIDLTLDGLRAALWQSGFAVHGQGGPYSGLPGAAGNVGKLGLEGWSQVESTPRGSGHILGKRVSIIILGFNQVEYTRKCIESIRRHTRQAYELILVDNGSHDGTEAFFRSIPGAKVIRNAANLGVSKGWNQGMRLAEGEYLLILNNDVIVGPDWLENMVRLAECDPGIGMVGPRSNYIAGPQLVPSVPYKTEAEIQGFIGDWQGKHALSASEFGFIKGFCLLIPRRVFDKVGFFDERYGKGNFEDDDYNVRVRYHGFRCLMAHDSFIHHYGSVSFNQESVDWKALMVENQRKYQEKWARGAAAIHDTQVSNPDNISCKLPKADSSQVADAKLAYAAGNIAKARGLFLAAQARDPSDPEAYCGLGVVLFHEGARQEASTLFLRCLELDPSHGDAGHNLLDLLGSEPGGFCPPDGAMLAAQFAGNPAFAPFASAASGKTGPGSEPSPAVGWKAEVETLIGNRDYQGAISSLEDNLRQGRELGACFNYLGIIAHACGDFNFAAEHFRKALARSPSDCDVIQNLADSLLLSGQAEAALALLDAPPPEARAGAEAAGLPDAAEQIRHALAGGLLRADHGSSGEYRYTAGNLIASRDRNRESEALLKDGSPEKARDAFAAILAGDPTDFRALNNMGLAAWYLGRLEDAFENFRKCLALRPAWSEALINAFDTALALGRVQDFQPLLAKALAAAPAHPVALKLRDHIGKEGLSLPIGSSFEELEQGAALLEEAEKELQAGRYTEATLKFLAALDGRPKHPQALNGLGITAFAQGKHADAYALFESAAALNPLDQDILMNLWQSAQALRREGEVVPKLRSSLEKDPTLGDVRAALKAYA